MKNNAAPEIQAMAGEISFPYLQEKSPVMQKLVVKDYMKSSQL